MNTRIAAVVLAALLIPASASALTTEEIQARIASLLSRIAQLQLQIQSFNSTGASTGSSTVAPTTVQPSLVCPNLQRSISLGSRGDDVMQLQSYLKYEGYLKQAYSPGYFDTPTETAVQQWQFEHGIVQGGSAETTGYGVLGPRTRALVALNCRASQSSVRTTRTGATQTGSGELTCPIAPQPTTVCSGGWQAVTDAYGCTQSYKCSVALTTVTTPSSCPIYQMPLCTSGTPQWRGNDAQGCSLGYQCPVVTGSSACAADITWLSSADYNNSYCTQAIEPMRCPHDSTYTYNASNGCIAGSLQSRGWSKIVQTTSSCASQVADATSYAANRMCGAGGSRLRCPTDSSYSVQTLSSCTESYLRQRGWTTADTVQASFNASPLSGPSPLTVTFTYPGAATRGYYVKFGNGQSYGMHESSPGMLTVSHTYASPGTYNATLHEGFGLCTMVQTSSGMMDSCSEGTIRGTLTITVTGSNGSASGIISNLSISGYPYTFGGTIPVSWTTSGMSGDVGMYIGLVDTSGSFVTSKTVAPSAGFSNLSIGSVCNDFFSDALDGGCQQLRSMIASGKTQYAVRAGFFTPSNACLGYCGPSASDPRYFFTATTPFFTIHDVAPQAVINKYNELVPTYSQSLGASITKCTFDSGVKYIVSGSGGFTGVNHYYDAQGAYLGGGGWSDAINPNYPPPAPPFNYDSTRCTVIQKSK